MRRTLDVFKFDNDEGFPEWEPLPPASRPERLRFDADRLEEQVQERQRELTALRNTLPEEEYWVADFRQEQITQLEQRIREDLRGIELSRALAGELEYQRRQAVDRIERWTFDIPDFGWEHGQLSRAEEAARVWDDDTTPRRDEWKFREVILQECIGAVHRPDGTSVPVEKLGPSWTGILWEALREKSEAGSSRVGFITSRLSASETEKP